MEEEKYLKTDRFACTTMIVGKDASIDGSVIIAHSDDDVSDTRVICVPSQPGGENITRPVYYDDACLGPKKYNSTENYNSTAIRRYIGTSRGEAYNTKDYRDSFALGKIPQTKNTFTYFDASYGIMNEHNLMIGECTCGAKVQPNPKNDVRIFYSAELSRVALERCKTAKEAIDLIGRLIYEYGYHGTGETLLLGDSEEGWVMEMCGYDMDGTDGLWVAQRVPDDHYFVEANEFRIRDIYINKNDKRVNNVNEPPYYFKSSLGNNPEKENDDLLYSSNLFKACDDKGWIKKDALHLDWLPTVSDGEYNHPYYSLRRVWRAFSKVAPSSNLPSKVEDGYTRAYPFSLKPDKKLSVLDVAAVYRDHYEGTDFDLTKGRAAGPFKNPVRYEGNPDHGDCFDLNKCKPDGAWERPLSIYRCGMMWINQAKKIGNDSAGFSWIGLDRPVANCLMPFYSRMQTLPKKIETMNLLEFDFNGSSAWWAFNFVANYANLNYEYMMKEVVALQRKLENDAEEKIKMVIGGQSDESIIDYCNANSDKVVDKWWKLAVALIVKYNDGCKTTGPNNIMEKIDYTESWLKDVGFYEGPINY